MRASYNPGGFFKSLLSALRAFTAQTQRTPSEDMDFAQAYYGEVIFVPKTGNPKPKIETIPT
jgi:hypothetical protein